MSVDVLSAPIAADAGDRSARARLVIGLLGVCFVFSIVLSLATGPTGVGLADLLAWLSGRADAMALQDRVILESVRIPRTLLGLLAGAGLAVSGAMMQGLFRNPLADPGIVGVTSGAALAAVIAIVLGGSVLAPVAALLGPWFLPLFAFVGGLINTLLL